MASCRNRAGPSAGGGGGRESGIPGAACPGRDGHHLGSWDTFESDREEQGRLLREALRRSVPGQPRTGPAAVIVAQILCFSDGRSAEAREMALEGTGMADRLDDPYTFFVSNIAATCSAGNPAGPNPGCRWRTGWSRWPNLPRIRKTWPKP